MPRVFFALWPDEDLRNQLAALQHPILSGRKLRADNLHLTLHYIGDVDTTDCLIEQAHEICFRASELVIDNYGVFRKARVLWAGPDTWSEELDRLAASCRQVADVCGYTPWGDRFRPHVTLARKIKQLPVLPAVAAVTWRYEHFSLVESVSTPDGVVYRQLGIF